MRTTMCDICTGDAGGAHMIRVEFGFRTTENKFHSSDSYHPGKSVDVCPSCRDFLKGKLLELLGPSRAIEGLLKDAAKTQP